MKIVKAIKKPRHTSAAIRVNCISIRKDLDPWYYKDLESFMAAVASCTVRTECAIRTKEEMAAASKDSAAWK